MKTNHKWGESRHEKLYFMNTTLNHPDNTDFHVRDSHKPVNFYCAAPRAKSVELVGDFNRWHPFPMTRSVDGWWLVQVHLAHGHHQYRFLVDGLPMLDPHATGIVPDGHGGRVSLIAVS
jgi:1,4-alpha-glucan branching enzyme